MTDLGVAIATPSARKARWVVVALLTVGVIIAYMDRINLSSALPVIRRSFPLSPEAAGILLSAFFWSYTLLQIPAGWAVDRFGLKWPFAAGLLLWSAFSAATALANSLSALIAVRIALGIGESVVTPASMRYMRQNFAEKERGLPIGIYMSGTKYGPAIGAPIAAYLIMDYGWRTMFVLCGALCFLWLVPWIALVKNDGQNATTPEETVAEEAVSWRSIFGAPFMWGTCIATFCYMYFVYFSMTWMPIYFKDTFGLSLTESGWFTFMSFAGLATIAILSGWLADRLIARGGNPISVRKAFTIAGFLLASSEVLVVFHLSTSLSLFLSVFSLSGLGLATANYWALTQTMTPAAASARVAGVQNTAANLAGIAAPWITGIFVQKTGHFNAPLIAVCFWLVVGVASYQFLVREEYALQ